MSCALATLPYNACATTLTLGAVADVTVRPLVATIENLATGRLREADAFVLVGGDVELDLTPEGLATDCHHRLTLAELDGTGPLEVTLDGHQATELLLHPTTVYNGAGEPVAVTDATLYAE